MAAVTLVVNPERQQARAVAGTLLVWLRDRGHEVRAPGDTPIEGARICDDEELASGVDLAVSLGGDGTMLRTVDLVSRAGVPVLGVNLGQLGYLSEVEPDGIEDALESFLAGRHAIEERMLLAVEIEPGSGARGEPIAPRLALNEVVLEKTPSGHMVRLAVSFDGEEFTTYAADGVIVATPTGSTAYSFSARGPIVDPSHRAILLTPVAAHMLFDRTLVLEPSTVVRLEVAGTRPATVSVDGRILGTLVEGDALRCTAAVATARLVTFRPRHFHRILKAKFGLNDR